MPACSDAIYYRSVGIVPATALRGQEALAPWQPTRRVNEHQQTMLINVIRDNLAIIGAGHTTMSAV
jgi:hypothetical protein